MKRFLLHANMELKIFFKQPSLKFCVNYGFKGQAKWQYLIPFLIIDKLFFRIAYTVSTYYILTFSEESRLSMA